MRLSGAKILITGDSHAEWSQFGVQLERKLREAGANVTRLAIGGSSARSWTRGEPVCRTMAGNRRCLTLADLRASGPYDAAIISLGTNDAANAHVAGGDLAAAARTTADRIRQFAGQIGAPETWVVGPPRVAGRNEHYTDANMAFVADAFAQAFTASPIRFIDSRAVPRIDGDGTHVGPRGGDAWSDLVVRAISSDATPASTPGPGGGAEPERGAFYGARWAIAAALATIAAAVSINRLR